MSRLAALFLLLFATLPLHALTDPQRWANNDPIGEFGSINLTMGMHNNPLN